MTQRDRAPGLSRRQDRDHRAPGAASGRESRCSRCENVSVLYGKAQALENVSIHVHEGEFVSVVGLNGAGKTTLFNAISGLVPYSGEIRWEGGAPCAANRGRDRPRRASCSARRAASCSAR